MNIPYWFWILIGFAIMSFLLGAPGTRAKNRYEQWRRGGGSMLDNYDQDTKDIDKFSR